MPESRGGPCAPPFRGNCHAAAGSIASGDRDRLAPPLHRNDRDLRQGRRDRPAADRSSLAGGATMLTHAVESYLSVRRACGFALKSQGSLLRSFAAFSEAKGKEHVCSQTAIAWAGLARSVHQRARRLNQVIRFARYVRAEDQRHELPPAVFGSEQRARPTPYIFSPDDIVRLVQAAAQSSHPFRRQTYRTLFCLALLHRTARVGGHPAAPRGHHSRRHAHPELQVPEESPRTPAPNRAGWTRTVPRIPPPVCPLR